MNAGMLIVSTCLSLAFLALVFIPLEKAFPARRQKTLRPGWATDLAFFAGQYFLWSGLIEQIPRSYLGQLLNPFYRRKMPRSHRRMAEDLRATSIRSHYSHDSYDSHQQGAHHCRFHLHSHPLPR